MGWYFSGSALLLNIVRLGCRAGISEAASCFIKAFKQSRGFGIFLAMCVLVPMTAIPFYFSLDSFTGYIAVVLLICAVIIIIPAVFMHIPLSILGPGGFFTIFGNAVKILFAESRVIVSSTVNSICILLLSALTAFLFPGMAMVLLCMEEVSGLVLQIYSAEMTEEQITELLNREAQKTEGRSIKTTIMPWKKK